jgi:cyclomaltodextrinase / maltogenic alpha-amylase / neopullulanase
MKTLQFVGKHKLTPSQSRLRRNSVAILLASTLLVLASCESKKKTDYTDRNLIVGLASPVKLSGDSTLLNLEDYVLDLSAIDSVSIPTGLRKMIDGHNLLLTGSLHQKIGSIFIWSNAQVYAIPLRAKNLVEVTFTFSGNAESVKMKGEFNAWNASQTTIQKSNNAFTTSLSLSPGRYQYLFVVDGKEMLDPNNKDSVDNGMGGWNSVIDLPKPDASKLPILSTHTFTDQTITLALSNPAKEVTVYWENFLLNEITSSDTSVTVEIPKEATLKKRSFIRAWAANDEGISNDLLVPLENGKVVNNATQLSRSDKEAQVLYFMMVDRFNNGNQANDEPVKDKSVHPKANYYGGDLAGITAKIKEGYFSKLGINTLWLSPITENPKGAYGKYQTPPTTFSAYHGYWPVSLQQIDYRFGNKNEFEELLSVAHANNINVILDYVAHHIHQEHPLFKEKPAWFTSLYLPDGTINTERWDDHRLTTWFDLFLPTLDLSKPEVVGPMTDTAMFWLEHYDLDGFRHDASKHIDFLFWRELTKKVKRNVIQAKGRSVYQIGETYGSRELVASYVNSGMLDGQFDFNVYDDAVATFARDEVSFSRVVNSTLESIAYFGDHHLMGNVTGNQDRARFISYADGSVRFDEDAKKAGWTRKIEVRDTTAYKKLSLLTAYMMTIPGVPVIYYGDEIGDPGGNDPDNRRMMRFNELSNHEKKTRVLTETMVNLRRNNLALIYGDWKVVSQSDTQLVVRRSYFKDQALIIFNKSTSTSEIALENVSDDVHTNFGNELTIEKGKASIVLKPFTFEILTTR